jgi:A/G-specific adenine glycosylase
MDLGATICTPRQPACTRCALKDICQAYALGAQDELPITSRKSIRPHHTVTAAVIWRDGKVLIAQRPANGLLGGLWEFPGGKLKPGEDLKSGLIREIEEELGVGIQICQPLGIYRHAYTHFRVTVHAFECTLAYGEVTRLHHDAIAWAVPGELSAYPMGKIDRLISQQLILQ